LYFIGREPLIHFKATFITFYICWALFLVGFSSLAQNFQTIKYLAPDIKKYASSNDVIAINTLGSISAPFYLGRRVEILTKDHEFYKVFQSKKRVFAVIDKRHLTYMQTKHIRYYRLASKGYNYLVVNCSIHGHVTEKITDPY
jgi:hypothetical protein